jgi:YggT family protein
VQAGHAIVKPDAAATGLRPRPRAAIQGRNRCEEGKMGTLYEALQLILQVVWFVMIVHIIMSWLINFQVLNLRQPLVAQIWDGLNRLLEPIYRPIRNILPNTGGLDLAPLVVFVIIIILQRALANNAGFFYGM